MINYHLKRKSPHSVETFNTILKKYNQCHRLRSGKTYHMYIQTMYFLKEARPPSVNKIQEARAIQFTHYKINILPKTVVFSLLRQWLRFLSNYHDSRRINKDFFHFLENVNIYANLITTITSTGLNKHSV